MIFLVPKDLRYPQISAALASHRTGSTLLADLQMVQFMCGILWRTNWTVFLKISDTGSNQIEFPLPVRSALA